MLTRHEKKRGIHNDCCLARIGTLAVNNSNVAIVAKSKMIAKNRSIYFARVVLPLLARPRQGTPSRSTMELTAFTFMSSPEPATTLMRPSTMAKLNLNLWPFDGT